MTSKGLHQSLPVLIKEFLSISIQKESIVPPNTFYLFKIPSFVGLQKQILVEHLCQRIELQIHCKEEYNKGDASTVYLFWTVRSKCSTNNLIVGVQPGLELQIFENQTRGEMSVRNSVVQLMSLFISS